MRQLPHLQRPQYICIQYGENLLMQVLHVHIPLSAGTTITSCSSEKVRQEVAGRSACNADSWSKPVQKPQWWQQRESRDRWGYAHRQWLVDNPFSQSSQLMIPLSKKSAERIVAVMKTTVKAHHHPKLNGGRTSLIKQNDSYAESPPCSNHCAMLRLPEGNQYGVNSQMRGIGSLHSGYWSRGLLIHPQISFSIWRRSVKR